MSRHVFTVRFPDDAEGSRVRVRYVSDRVSVQCGLVGDRTNLLDGQLRTRLVAVRKGRFESFVLAEGYVRTGAQASGRLLGRRGGVLRCGLRDVLIQPSENEKITILFMLLQFKQITSSRKHLSEVTFQKSSSNSYAPFNVHVFFF